MEYSSGIFTSDLYGSLLKNHVGQASAADHGNTALGDVVAARPIGIRIEPDGIQFRNLHSGVHNRPSNAAIAADFHVGHENRILHFTITVHTHSDRKSVV